MTKPVPTVRTTRSRMCSSFWPFISSARRASSELVSATEAEMATTEGETDLAMSSKRDWRPVSSRVSEARTARSASGVREKSPGEGAGAAGMAWGGWGGEGGGRGGGGGREGVRARGGGGGGEG